MLLAKPAVLPGVEIDLNFTLRLCLRSSYEYDDGDDSDDDDDDGDGDGDGDDDDGGDGDDEGEGDLADVDQAVVQQLNQVVEAAASRILHTRTAARLVESSEAGKVA